MDKNLADLNLEKNLKEELCLDDVDMEQEEVEESNKFFNIFNWPRKFWVTLACINAVSICLTIYMQSFMWLPKKRTLCDDNLFCNSSLVISDTELDEIVGTLENELNVTVVEDDKDEYALLYAVLENDDLTDSEKNIFYRFIDLIKDNPYLDKESAYRSLRNVEVSYKHRPFGYDKTIQGVYSYDYESIGIFEEDDDNSILIHEGIHCIFNNEKTDKLPVYFKEGMVELLANEYFSETPYVELKNYPFNICGVKILCEVTSPDTILKAFSCGDMDIIAEEIATFTGDIDVARNALNNFEKIFLKHTGQLDEKDAKLSYEEMVNECISLFRNIVTTKYEEEEPNRVAYFYNEILLSNILGDDEYNNYVDDLYEFGIKKKAYFSSKLKQEFVSENDNDKVNVYKITANEK